MNKLKPALLGGLIVGVLSSIPVLNYCCLIWSIGGGVLAGFLYIKSSPVPVKIGEGALIGVLSGIIGAILYFIIGVPIAYFISGGNIDAALRGAGLQLPAGLSGLMIFVISGLVVGAFLLVFSIIGGLISVPIFEKRKDALPPPPPPQDFAGGPGI
jgi:hypothetical protein